MQTTIPINLGSASPDEDLIEGDITPSTGNQLEFYRVGSGTFRNFVTVVTPDDIIIDYDPVTAPSHAWIDSSEHRRWEVYDAKATVIEPSDFAHFEQALRIVNTGSIGTPDALTFALVAANIDRPTTHTSMHTILSAWLENRIQIKVQDATKEIKEYYEEQLADKESEIRALSNELSEIKKMNQQENLESEEIKNQYREEITKIPEVQQAMYKENVKEIQFITMFSDPKKALSDEVYEIENKLGKKYPDWSLDFQYIGPRKYPEKLKEKYNLL